ncbi:hypothetical protein SmJEL517_g04596 [Synchytrium microbalum]|uniref:Alpha-1,3/1,6-mannosyltransferase ALG2 n=1 Tax=Synchytrium microbalum TaxID=1806994 RepID=A0A507C3Y1_9FUNG|nr:uncharacterized protein SmJEL517_g04596 [Synchytrium microbalum]TPX32275.1 hypothetical protein SmJEL517_g04596 [Synchytrium microbalum]
MTALNIAFVHPDLGIGGAERLVVDAAIGLQSRGHKIAFYTSHHDIDHCFDETRDGTLKVAVFGDFLPRSILKRGHVVFAMIRSLYLAMIMVLLQPRYDVIFVDQVSASIPILRLTGSKILFYCHFPDKLLSTRESLVKRIYRAPVDYAEELTTKMSDEILVNSAFTASVFKTSFPRIRKSPRVLHPGLQVNAYRQEIDLDDVSVKPIISDKITFLSINRFERKKNLALAIQAFAEVCKLFEKGKMRLLMAGGYDPRVTENVEYMAELEALARQLSLTTHTLTSPNLKAIPAKDTNILFLPSFTHAQRTYLLNTSTCLLYTPQNEHFGIVPLEAMISSLIVIASNTGGPKESVVDNVTGYLVDDTISGFADAMGTVLGKSVDERREMGRMGRERVEELFSLRRFTDMLEGVLRDVCDGRCGDEAIPLVTQWLPSDSQPSRLFRSIVDDVTGYLVDTISGFDAMGTVLGKSVDERRVGFRVTVTVIICTARDFSLLSVLNVTFEENSLEKKAKKDTICRYRSM